MAKKNTILLSNDDYGPIQDFTIEQKGRMLDAIFNYSINGEEVVDDDIKVAFKFFKQRIDKHNEKYDETCKRRSEAGQKGMEARWKGTENQEDITNITNITKITNGNKNNKHNRIGMDRIGMDGIGGDRMFSNENDIDISSGIASNSSSNPKSDDAVAVSRKSKLDDIKKADSIIDLYNRRIAETGCRLRSCVAKSEKRRGMVLARLKEHGEENVRVVIEKAVASHFLNYGTRNGEPMDIEWIFGRDNFPKVLEGKYDRDRASPPKPERPLYKSPYPDISDEDWEAMGPDGRLDTIHRKNEIMEMELSNGQ